MITRWLARRLDDRLGFSPAARAGLNRVFPDHWSFLLGELAIYFFGYLIVSGLFLTLFYEPSEAPTVYEGSYDAVRGARVSAAYATTLTISQDIRFGLVVRQSHHWAALLLAGVVVLHLCRVFFTGGFRRPRELNWVVGVAMLAIIFVSGFTGYTLPDDLLSGLGLNIANSVLLSIPVVGPWLAFLAWGGEFTGPAIFPRLYTMHVIVLPALLLALIALHVLIVVRQRHGQFPGPGRTESNVVGPRIWPARAVRSLGLLAAAFAVCLGLGGLVQINPIWYWGFFAPGHTYGPAQPDWYIGWVDGALRLWPGPDVIVFGHRVPSIFWPGVVLPGITFLVLLLYPWIERRITGDRRGHHLLDRPRDRPGRVAFGVWALTFYLLLLTAWSLDVVTRFTGFPVWALLNVWRYLVLFVPIATGLLAFVIARALRDSEAEHAIELTTSDLRKGLRRKPHPELEVASEPEEPEKDEEDEEDEEPAPEDVPGPDRERPLPVRIEPGPVP